MTRAAMTTRPAAMSVPKRRTVPRSGRWRRAARCALCRTGDAQGPGGAAKSGAQSRLLRIYDGFVSLACSLIEAVGRYRARPAAGAGRPRTGASRRAAPARRAGTAAAAARGGAHGGARQERRAWAPAGPGEGCVAFFWRQWLCRFFFSLPDLPPSSWLPSPGRLGRLGLRLRRPRRAPRPLAPRPSPSTRCRQPWKKRPPGASPLEPPRHVSSPATKDLPWRRARASPASRSACCRRRRRRRRRLVAASSSPRRRAAPAQSARQPASRAAPPLGMHQRRPAARPAPSVRCYSRRMPRLAGLARLAAPPLAPPSGKSVGPRRRPTPTPSPGPAPAPAPKRLPSGPRLRVAPLGRPPAPTYNLHHKPQ